MNLHQFNSGFFKKKIILRSAINLFVSKIYFSNDLKEYPKIKITIKVNFNT